MDVSGHFLTLFPSTCKGCVPVLHSNRLITIGGLKSDRHGTRAVNALNLLGDPLDSQDCDYITGIPEEDFGNVGSIINGRLTICGGDDGERYCYQQNSTRGKRMSVTYVTYIEKSQ